MPEERKKIFELLEKRLAFWPDIREQAKAWGLLDFCEELMVAYRITQEYTYGGRKSYEKLTEASEMFFKLGFYKKADEVASMAQWAWEAYDAAVTSEGYIRM